MKMLKVYMIEHFKHILASLKEGQSQRALKNQFVAEIKVENLKIEEKIRRVQNKIDAFKSTINRKVFPIQEKIESMRQTVEKMDVDYENQISKI
jgi:hypothetical protein